MDPKIILNDKKNSIPLDAKLILNDKKKKFKLFNIKQ